MDILRVPLLNANEDELEVVDVLVEDGESVHQGDILATIESTKSTIDLESPRDGFVRKLDAREGDRIKVGAVFCVITETAGEEVSLPEEDQQKAGGAFKATRKARALAEAEGLELADLGISGIIKERDVRAYLEGGGGHSARSPAKRAPAIAVAGSGDRVVILGAGGHASVLIDMMREGRRDLRIAAIVDDSPQAPTDVLGVPVVGSSEQLAVLREQGSRRAVLGVGAVTNNSLRIELYQKLLDAGFEMPNMVHPRAIVEPSVRMGMGNQIFGGAIVSSRVELGVNTIINSGVVVSHDCRIGSHSHVTPGAILAGNVHVGRNTVIGMGVSVYLGVRIGDDCMIANGMDVMHDVPDGTVLRAKS